MEVSEEKKRGYVKRLLLARMRLLAKQGFFGVLMMHMKFALDENCGTAATDGVRMYFCPEFLDELDDRELDFVMTHEVMHCVLRHCLRKEDRDHGVFNVACDIVVNSNIMLEHGMDIASITLKKYGPSMHVAPNGEEGYKFTAEQVYDMLIKRGDGGRGQRAASGSGAESVGEGDEASGGRDNAKNDKNGSTSGGKSGRRVGNGRDGSDRQWDDHTRWGTVDDAALEDVWVKRFRDACEAISVRDPSNRNGMLPLFARRLLKELKSPKMDWRSVLSDFVQEEINDYSFAPPDARFAESPFFLPAFNDRDEYAEDILFMIDTSGSMSDDMVTTAYSEVKGAIDCFDGKLKGWLGFFDAAVSEPQPFSDVGELKGIKPVGGGGTDFGVVFEYVKRRMADKPPACIIMLTDGYAPFPPESAANGVPVLWLINNEDVNPPWGKTARIED